ncbi:DUF805 domain-containing protein [Clavibacter zhangzhiyongii]|uniref:DUF805 domain-containing protein n=1 Tax=Clavibacter zhangzhiyongii TaxID=2768071 RepID=UPI00195E04C4|nr:DUF805 domain-containing protein [Clavibacter zhangzhiyongii]MBM7026265.1 DUF805 domain-containing protein [Clavibacter zhangzhiyongii]
MTAAMTPGSRPPLELPLPGASWAEALRRFFLKYATFRGRASRSEFWWWVLTGFLASNALDVLSGLSTGGRDPMDVAGRFAVVDVWSGISAVLELAVFIPSLAVSWRRLHDTDRSGTWTLINFIPILGQVVYVVMTASRSRPSGARFD